MRKETLRYCVSCELSTTVLTRNGVVSNETPVNSSIFIKNPSPRINITFWKVGCNPNLAFTGQVRSTGYFRRESLLETIV